MKKSNDLKGLIPSGNELRILLNSNYITEGEINTTLKSKGVFCGNGEKTISVPLLSAMLLTSSEYESIVDNSISRTLKPKFKSSRLELNSNNSNWKEPIKELFSSDFNPLKDIPNIELISKIQPVFCNNYTVKIPYKIKRNDFSKDFLNRELDFHGEVVITRQGDGLNIEMVSTHTSNETELINRRMSAAISKKLKDSGVAKSDVENRITFSSFEDIERVRFFKRLTGGLGKELTLSNVNEIVISREASNRPLPNDPQVSWMNDTVKYMSIDGDRLHAIFLISDEKYYEYYFIYKMHLNYRYAIGTNTGECKVVFFFSSLSRKQFSFDIDSELTFEIGSIKNEIKIKHTNKKELERKISEKLRKMVQFKFDEILKERNISSKIK
ncbi:GapS4b family protein [Rodentibacter haemolyticus]|uniref:GAPS4b N-terminal domain-containing protein n=1 Tax=Rodentibacter haemolyticus TaxID=2778911 RepID=A0ABX6V395_9PAST|nr:hypothetical protein [Rodentibacter haemolyticus]QPB42756.1 hypothetical protein IHV77_01105 [Rodentibacter haemolyticus]